MLATLQIENYALIERLLIEFGPGLNVLSGETGSGKSIVVGALGLLLGERADAQVIREGAATAAVTGLFVASGAPDGGETLLRRELGPGRSRAFVDDRLSTLAGLRQVARPLGDIHSQNEALVAFSPAAQLELLDRFAGIAIPEVAAAFAAWQAADQALRAFATEQRARLQQLDLCRFQEEEIDALRPLAGEDERLEAEHKVLGHAEKITAAADAAYRALYDDSSAASTQLKAALRQLQEWQRWDAAVVPLAQRLEAARLECDDVAGEIRHLGAGVEPSPARLSQVDDRLAALDRLKRKYGPTLADVLAHRARLAQEVEAAQQVSLEAAQAASDGAAAEYRRLAEAVSRRRRAAASKLAQAVAAEVSELAMSVQFEVVFDPAQAWRATGWDQVEFRAALNPGEAAKPVAQAASGGELSRLLLALHLVIEHNVHAGSPSARRTLVLDEVDAGIGGRAAEAVGRKLRQLAQHHQVLCVTHLAQIASQATTHLQVEKHTVQGRTRTTVTALEGQAREAEIARMLAGRPQDPAALGHARELLAAAAPTAAPATPRRGARSRG